MVVTLVAARIQSVARPITARFASKLETDNRATVNSDEARTAQHRIVADKSVRVSTGMRTAMFVCRNVDRLHHATSRGQVDSITAVPIRAALGRCPRITAE